MKSMMPMVVLIVLVTVSFIFAWQGISMHKQVGIEEASFHQLQGSYFILSKQEREAAITGSDLNQILVKIQNYPSELLMLKLVGVGKILTGIFVLLFGILFVLFMMPRRLATLMKEEQK